MLFNIVLTNEMDIKIHISGQSRKCKTVGFKPLKYLISIPSSPGPTQPNASIHSDPLPSAAVRGWLVPARLRPGPGDGPVLRARGRRLPALGADLPAQETHQRTAPVHRSQAGQSAQPDAEGQHMHRLALQTQHVSGLWSLLPLGNTWREPRVN